MHSPHLDRLSAPCAPDSGAAVGATPSGGKHFYRNLLPHTHTTHTHTPHNIFNTHISHTRICGISACVYSTHTDHTPMPHTHRTPHTHSPHTQHIRTSHTKHTHLPYPLTTDTHTPETLSAPPEEDVPRRFPAFPPRAGRGEIPAELLAVTRWH